MADGPYRRACIPPPPKVPRESVLVRAGRVVTPGRAVALMVLALPLALAAFGQWHALAAMGIVFGGGAVIVGFAVAIASIGVGRWPWDGGS